MGLYSRANIPGTGGGESMGRQAKGYWDDQKRRYYVRLVDPETGKKRAHLLTHPDGRHIAEGDVGAVAAAVRRSLGEREEASYRPEGPTVAEVCKAFVAWHAENGSAQRTVDDHHYHLTRLSRFEHGGVQYANRPASSIGPEDVWRLKQAGLGSLRLLYASILACWRWAARPVEGRTPPRMLASNPLAGLAKPPAGAPVEKGIPWKDARKLVRFAWAWASREPKTRRSRTRAARRLQALCLCLIADTGCRPHEAWGLEWDEILWGEGFLRIVERSKTRRTRKARNVPVGKRVMQLLAKVREWEGAHPRYVFLPAWTRSEGPPRTKRLIDWFAEELRPAALAAGVPIPPEMTLYYLRHEWQTTGLEVESIEGVSAAAGNSPKVLLDRYEHTKRRRIREVAEKIAQRRRTAGV
jgi:integrase